MFNHLFCVVCTAILFGAYAGSSPAAGVNPGTTLSGNKSFEVRDVTHFDQPWAMTFLPDGRLLVTEKSGKLKLFDIDKLLSLKT